MLVATSAGLGLSTPRGGLGVGSSAAAVRAAKEKLNQLGFLATSQVNGVEDEGFSAAIRAFQTAWNSGGCSTTVSERPPRSCTRQGVRRGLRIAQVPVDGDFGCRVGYALVSAVGSNCGRAPAGFTPIGTGGIVIGVPGCRDRGVPCFTPQATQGGIAAQMRENFQRNYGSQAEPGTNTDNSGGVPENVVAPPSWIKKHWWKVALGVVGIGTGTYFIVSSNRSQVPARTVAYRAA